MKVSQFKSFFVIIFLLTVGVYQGVWSQNTIAKKPTISKTAKINDSLGNPIVNASVFANQGAVQTKTDVNGVFKINVYPDSYVLIESEGYNTKTIKALDMSEEIVLTKNDFIYGTKNALLYPFRDKNKDVSIGNITEIRPAEVLATDNVARLQDMLDAYGAGLKGNYNLLGLGDALVIVDGLPRNASNLLPEEIEDITLLKDVNSTVLYGSKAKNGVILIKTKRGVSNKRIIKMNIEQGVNTPVQLPNYLDAQDYMKLYTEARLNDNPNSYAAYDEATIAKYDGSNPYRYPDIDYYGKDYLNSFFNSTRFVGEFSGGNNIASYYANVGYEHQGVLYKANNGQNNGSDRLRVRGNVDFNINKYIKSYIDAAFIFNVSSGLRTDFFTMASTFKPTDYPALLPIDAFEDPTLTDNLTHVNGNYILGGSTALWNNSYGKNVVGELSQAGYSKNYNSTMQFNTGIIYNLEQITKGLTLHGNISFDTYGSYAESIQNTYALYEPKWNDATGKISSITTINSNSKTGVLNLSSGGLARTIGANVYLDYDRTFNDVHHFSSTILTYYTMATVPGQIQTDKNAHAGLKISYDYKKSYIIDFTGALINSTKLAPGHRVSFSPTVGLGWVISNASFWTKNNIVDYLKIKGTVGILNTDASAAFGYNRYRDLFSGYQTFRTGDAGGYSFSSTYVSQTGNPNLELEKMNKINIGFETAIFGKSLFLDANYFYCLYSDQITQRFNYYPSLLSSYIPYENYNASSYQGVDVTLNFKKKWKDFSLSSSLNFLYSTSKFEQMDEIQSNDYQYLVGKPTDSYWGLKNLGFFSSDEEAKTAQQRFGYVRRGDIHYVDLDGNGFVDNNDNSVIGNWSPRIQSQLNISLAYKSFSLFVAASTQFGFDWLKSSDYFWIDGNKKYSEIVLNRWTDATAETATYPRLSGQTSPNNFRNSDFWLVSGDNLKISRVQLNYTMPERLFKDFFIKGISAYVRGTDLLLLTQEAKLKQTNSWVSTRVLAIGFKISY